ncbi:hypothetical protein LTR36_010235 [Oleoguttula mirabilis]|uniref:Protein kinase domain-containing protein n=1 Tax=Oleoguttula mirabilis TaxID=1507867 RepID=A0AAV9JSE6_9PEZI|nr:hypothetical protein LTR36_010235 [Oleoguttula mirabilis]
MPHLFSFAGHGNNDADALQEMEHELPHKPPRRPSLLKNIGSLLKRHLEVEPLPQTAPPEQAQPPDYFPFRRRSFQDHSASTRRAIPSLPRPQTFRRQQSERRERLLEVEPSPTEKRALSHERRRCLSASAARRPSSPRPIPYPSLSAPEVGTPDQLSPCQPCDQQSATPDAQKPPRDRRDLPPLQIPEQLDDGLDPDEQDDEHHIDKAALPEEYGRRWILNLSMHFRDRSNREKFFVTYAETPSKWRRITVSLDYRNAPDGSLEADLSTLHYQRDKSFRIYEAIRESLPDIQYYDTVTNLKLETTPDDDQLHVHVREDANEIVQYPSSSLLEHIDSRSYPESEVQFISHLSGFVYKVRAGGKVVIKKEIPGPDTVDEFLYEVNALDSLLGCDHVVQLEGLVTDDSGSVVKGLLISYASQGALVDMLYDFRDTRELPWHRREKWAKQIVQGLADIHEAGFVQGDFTLSNIVIDGEDNAQIIDINRRGCPVGWEPPELGRLIDSGQRIGMCIGVKTDLFQLGMVLWALAEEVDEPERVERPLPPVIDAVPSYFRHIVKTCLCERPQGRVAANRLLRQFPATAGVAPSTGRPSVDFTERLKASDQSISTHRSDKEYIDPKLAVTLEEVRRRRDNTSASDFTAEQVTYVDPDSNAASTSYHFESSGSWIVGHRRGRSPVSSRRRRSSPFGRTASSATSLSSASPVTRRQPCASPDYAACEGGEKAGEATMSMVYPPEITAEDLTPPALGIAPIGDTEICEQSTPRTVADKRLSTLRGEDFTQLVHTDSGFDEHMVDELQIEAPVRESDIGGARNTDIAVEAESYDTNGIRQI